MTEQNEPVEDETHIAQLVVSMRIYDVLMALLREENEDVARSLLELHATGALAGPSPAYVGKFLTDELNS